MKKIISYILPAVLLVSMSGIASAFDLSQEINQSGGTIKIDEKTSLDIDAQTFASNVNFAAKSINDIDGKTDTTKYDDKGFGAFSLSFQDKSGKPVENSKAIKIGIMGLDSYKQPVLLKSSSGTVEEVAGQADLDSYVFSVEKSPSANYKIVEKKSADASATSTDTAFVTSGNTNTSLDASGATSLGSTDSQVSLESKDPKGANSITLILLLLLTGVGITTLGVYGLKKI